MQEYPALTTQYLYTERGIRSNAFTLCNILYNYRMLSADGQSSFSASTYTQVKILSIPKYLLHSLKGGLHTTITLGLLGYFNQTCNVTAPLLRDCRDVLQSALRARLETMLQCRCRLTAQGRVALPGYSTTSVIQHPHLYINHTSTHSALIVEFKSCQLF